MPKSRVARRLRRLRSTTTMAVVRARISDVCTSLGRLMSAPAVSSCRRAVAIQSGPVFAHPSCSRRKKSLIKSECLSAESQWRTRLERRQRDSARRGETWRETRRDVAKPVPETNGNRRKPTETDGNQRKPTETDGNRRKSTESNGNRRAARRSPYERSRV